MTPDLHAPSGPFAQLVDALGMPGADEDAADEHWRWRVYRAAVATPGLEETLLEAVRAEPLIALAVVLEVLERVTDDEAARWVAVLSGDDRRYATARASDIVTARRTGGPDAMTSASAVESWSDWLQRRVAHGTDSVGVLGVLERHGRTRRVRGAARERLRLSRGV